MLILSAPLPLSPRGGGIRAIGGERSFYRFAHAHRCSGKANAAAEGKGRPGQRGECAYISTMSFNKRQRLRPRHARRYGCLMSRGPLNEAPREVEKEFIGGDLPAMAERSRKNDDAHIQKGRERRCRLMREGNHMLAELRQDPATVIPAEKDRCSEWRERFGHAK